MSFIRRDRERTILCIQIETISYRHPIDLFYCNYSLQIGGRGLKSTELYALNRRHDVSVIRRDQERTILCIQIETRDHILSSSCRLVLL